MVLPFLTGCAGGWSWRPRPRVLPPSANLAQIIEVVNRNSARVVSLKATGRINSPALPVSLSADIALQRSHNLRVRASSLLGPEFDLGSNDQHFWVWVKRGQPPAVYFCRHDEFAVSPARHVVPVDPTWMIEAFGLASFDPRDSHQGPAQVGQGRLRIESVRQSAVGPVTKVTIVDEKYGDVLEQHVYDSQQRLVASALTSKHQLDPASGAWLPRRIDIRWPTTQVELQIDLANLEVNTLDASSTALWTKPQYPGYADFNLGDPNLRLGPPAGSLAPAPTATSRTAPVQPTVANMPPRRGIVPPRRR